MITDLISGFWSFTRRRRRKLLLIFALVRFEDLFELTNTLLNTHVGSTSAVETSLTGLHCLLLCHRVCLLS